MWKELKTLQFTCDLCHKTDTIYDVHGYRQPPGWGYRHPENGHSMFEKSLDLCPDCLSKENV